MKPTHPSPAIGATASGATFVRPDADSCGPATARRLIPLVEWPLHHPWPPLGGLRHLVRHRRTNGFARVVRRVGARLLVDEAAFFAWADSQERFAPEDLPAAVESDTR